MAVDSFRDLIVWQKAMALAERVYVVTESFPRRDQFGLTQQLRRSALSIPSNIAEGHALSTAAYVNHLHIALGSKAELETQLELALRLGYATAPALEALLKGAAEVGRMLSGLVSALGHARSRRRP